jgi:hypothetical protein
MFWFSGKSKKSLRKSERGSVVLTGEAITGVLMVVVAVAALDVTLKSECQMSENVAATSWLDCEDLSTCTKAGTFKNSTHDASSWVGDTTISKRCQALQAKYDEKDTRPTEDKTGEGDVDGLGDANDGK